MTVLKSMRGDKVDTDLFKIKQQLANGKKTDPTVKRENYVNDRRRRSSSRRVSEMLANEQMVKQKLNEQKANQPEELLDVVEASEHVVDSTTEVFDGFKEETAPEATAEATPHKRVIKKQG